MRGDQGIEMPQGGLLALAGTGVERRLQAEIRVGAIGSCECRSLGLRQEADRRECEQQRSRLQRA